MVFKKSLNGLLTGLLVGARALLPLESKADGLEVGSLGDSINVYGSVDYNRHNSGFLEYEGGDTAWTNGPVNLNNKFFKVYSEPYGIQLYSDGRPLESESTFINKLAVADKIGEGVTSTNSIKFRFSSGSDPTRHYTAKIHCDGAYTPSGSNFDKVVNIRDVIDAGGYVGLPGITNVPNGTVYGTVEVNPQFNRVVSTKSGNGTNSLENVIVNYGDSITNVLNAANDYYVQQYILTRTDNTGVVSVVTNNMAGQTITSTNIAMNNLKGSNAIHAVYAPKVTTNGIPYTWLTQYGITNKTDSVETQDGDEDKVTTLEEYFADTNPTNQNSYFQVGSLACGDQIVLGINPSSTGRVYGVNYKTNLMDAVWNSATNDIPGNGSNLLINLNQDADRKFYRANVRLKQ